MEFGDLPGHVLRPAEGDVALRRPAEVHFVTLGKFARRDLEGGLAALVDAAEEADGQAEAVEGAARRLARAADRRQARFEHLRRHDIGEPTVAQAAGPLQRGLGPPAAPDRRAARARRRRLDPNLGKLVETAVICRRLAAPKPLQHLHRFRQSRAPFVHGHAAGGVFVWKLATDADAENQPPGRQQVERGHLLRHQDGVAERRQIDAAADVYPLAQYRDLGQLNDDVQHRHRPLDMVAEPEGVVAVPLQERDPGPDRVGHQAGRGNPEAEAGGKRCRLHAEHKYGSSPSPCGRGAILPRPPPAGKVGPGSRWRVRGSPHRATQEPRTGLVSVRRGNLGRAVSFVWARAPCARVSAMTIRRLIVLLPPFAPPSPSLAQTTGNAEAAAPRVIHGE